MTGHKGYAIAVIVDMLSGVLASVPLAQGCAEVLYPGEMEANNDARNRREGLQLPEDMLADLARIARETGLESRLPLS